jgi:hypothetical protein
VNPPTPAYTPPTPAKAGVPFRGARPTQERVNGVPAFAGTGGGRGAKLSNPSQTVDAPVGSFSTNLTNLTNRLF